ncbi:hypothetical protein ACKLTP_18565, partial [Paenarthrobacter ureafaciens]
TQDPGDRAKLGSARMVGALLVGSALGCNIEDKRASERAKIHGQARENKSKTVHTLIEGAQSQGWNEALGILAITYPERIEPYLG